MNSKEITINKARKLLPEETKDLIDAQVRFMLSRIGKVPESELRAAWQREHDSHVKEVALFLYDVYQEHKKKIKA